MGISSISGSMSKRPVVSFADRIFLTGRLPYLWVILAVLILYSGTMSFSFTYFDDDALIIDNREFLSDPSNIFDSFSRRVFSDPHNSTPFYRPMLEVSLLLDAQIGGSGPFIYHFTNVAIHAIACCLLFLLLTKLGYSAWPSFLLSMTYAVHPALCQAIAWIPGRNDSLLTVFALASFVSLLNFLAGRKWKWCLFHQFFFFLALFTKESAIFIIPLSVLYIFLFERPKAVESTEKLAPGWLFLLVLWHGFRGIALYGMTQPDIMNLIGGSVFGFPGIVQLLGKMILPFNLSPMPTIKDTPAVYGVCSLLLLAASVLFPGRRSSGRMILFGSVWFIVFLLPSAIGSAISWYVVNKGRIFLYCCSQIFLEHRLHLAAVGLALVLSEIGFIKCLRPDNKRILAWFAAVFLIFAATTLGRMHDFENALNFWKSAARTSPNLPRARHNLAAACFYSGMDDASRSEIVKVLAIAPQAAGARKLLALLCLKKGDPKGAEKFFREEAAVNPQPDEALTSLGLLYMNSGRPEDAESSWRRALRVNSGSRVVWKNLAVYYHENGDLERARICVRYLMDRFGESIPDNVLRDLGMRQG